MMRAGSVAVCACCVCGEERRRRQRDAAETVDTTQSSATHHLLSTPTQRCAFNTHLGLVLLCGRQSFDSTCCAWSAQMDRLAKTAALVLLWCSSMQQLSRHDHSSPGPSSSPRLVTHVTHINHIPHIHTATPLARVTLTQRLRMWTTVACRGT